MKIKWNTFTRPVLAHWIPEVVLVSASKYSTAAAAAAKSRQSCLTLCDPIDSSPPGSPVPRILQARTLEWVAIFFSNAWKWKVKVKSLSPVWLLMTPWTAAYQAPLSMGFSRQEYWSGVPLPSLSRATGAVLFRVWDPQILILFQFAPSPHFRRILSFLHEIVHGTHV